MLFWFCHTAKYISHRCTYIPSVFNLPSTLHPPKVVTEHQVELPVLYIQELPTSYLLYLWWCVCLNVNLSVCPTLSFPQKSVLYVCVYIPALQIGFSVSFFSNTHIHTHTHIFMCTCVLIQGIFLFLTYFTVHNRLQVIFKVPFILNLLDTYTDDQLDILT